MNKKVIAASVAMAGTMLATAPAADADAYSFMQYLNDHNMVVTDVGSAMRVGYGVCNAIDAGVAPGEVGVYLYRNISWATTDNAAAIVAGAIIHLCPYNMYLV